MFTMYPFGYDGYDFEALPAYRRPTWNRRNEAYYTPTHIDLASQLRELERRRAEEEAQERLRRQQQLQEERRRRLAREQAYRQWLADYERERNIFDNPFCRRPFDYNDYESDDYYESDNNNDVDSSEVGSVTNGESTKCETSESSSTLAIPKISPDEAARRITRFMRHSIGKLRMTRILAKLHELRVLDKRLGELHAQHIPIGRLTFDEERPRKLLPISAVNKAFLGYEDVILKTLDELDRIQSEGVELVRDLRRAIVGRAQRMLDDLDAECDRQWTEYSQKLKLDEGTEAAHEAGENASEVREPQTEPIVPAELSNSQDPEGNYDTKQGLFAEVHAEEGSEKIVKESDDVTIVPELVEVSIETDENATTDGLVQPQLQEQEAANVLAADSTARTVEGSDSDPVIGVQELDVVSTDEMVHDVEPDNEDDMVEVTMHDANDDETHKEDDGFVVVHF